MPWSVYMKKCQDIVGGPTFWPPPVIVERHSLNDAAVDALLWLPWPQVVVRVRNPPRRLCKDAWGETNSFATVSITHFSKDFIVVRDISLKTLSSEVLMFDFLSKVRLQRSCRLTLPWILHLPFASQEWHRTKHHGHGLSHRQSSLPSPASQRDKTQVEIGKGPPPQRGDQHFNMKCGFGVSVCLCLE